MIGYNFGAIAALVLSVVLSYLIIPKIIIFAKRYKLADVAGKRASHIGSIPILGGIAIFLSLVLSLFLFSDTAENKFIISSLIVVFFVGMIDDLLGLSAYKKLIGQIIATLILIFLSDLRIDNFHGVLGIYEISYMFSVIFTLFVVIVIINGVNLIDGIDGLAAGASIISAFFFGIIFYFLNQYNMLVLSSALIGSLLAFLKFNSHPAKIFMGDTGSLLIGMVLSILAINLIRSGIVLDTYTFPNKGPLLAIAFLSLPLYDSLRIFIARIVKGKHPLKPGRGHIHHAMLDLGIGHRNTSLILCLFSLVLILVAILMLSFNISFAIFILSLIAFLFLLIPFYILRKKK